MSALTRGAGGLVAAGAAALVWGTMVERNWYVLREGVLPVLPEGADPIRVLHLSDLHMAPWQRRKQEWVAGLAERVRPDLVVTTGDNLGHERGLEGIRRAFAPLSGVPGVFVWGSNDYWGPQLKNPFTYFARPSSHASAAKRLDTASLGAYFAELGWTDLNNTAALETVKGTAIEFFGVDDPHRGYDRPDKVVAALDDLRGDSPGDVSIGVLHAPYQRVLDLFVTQGADALFAGHTHGGQVCVPGYGALVTNCDIPRGQVKGLSRWHHAGRAAWLSVCAGLGTSIYAPARFACRPEAWSITLIPR